jgi:hypothetical protein
MMTFKAGKESEYLLNQSLPAAPSMTWAFIWFMPRLTGLACQSKLTYAATKAANGIDLHGLARLHYDKFDVALIFGKDQQSFLPSEVYAHTHTLWLDNLGMPAKVRAYDGPAVFQDLSQHTAENPLVDEVNAFSLMFTNRDDAQFEQRWQLTGQVNCVLDQLRASARIEFESGQD